MGWAANANPIAAKKKATIAGTFTSYPSLVTPLPPLIRKQRRLEAQLAAVGETAKEEKAVRADIDKLLVEAGLTKGELVTCLGYDVLHQEKAGQSSINGETLKVRLLAEGIDADLIERAIAESTKQGSPAVFCTVKPSKGAKVRA